MCFAVCNCIIFIKCKTVPRFNGLCYDLICCFGDLLLGTYRRAIAFQPNRHHLCRSIIPFAAVEAYRGVINDIVCLCTVFSLWEKYEIKDIGDFGATTRFRKQSDVLSGLFCGEEVIFSFFPMWQVSRGRIERRRRRLYNRSRCRIFRMISDENSNRASGEPRRMSS